MRNLGKATVSLLMLESPDADMKPLRQGRRARSGANESPTPQETKSQVNAPYR